MSRVIPVVAVALVLGGTASHLAAQDSFPSRPPKPTRLAPARFPPFQEMTLPNGLPVVVIERHEVPTVSVTLSFRAGDVTDPVGKEGLAQLAALVLTKGTATRSAEDIAAAIEGSGGRLTANTGDDFLTIQGDALADQVSLLFTLLGDVAQNASFPSKEVELARTRELSALGMSISEPVSVALRYFRREIYGTSMYGRYATEDSYRAITRDDLVAFGQARLRPTGALLVVAGDVTLAQVQALAQQAFTGWTGGMATPPATVTPTAPHGAGIILVHRPSSIQSFIILGNTTITPADPIYYAARVATYVLGGGADSRLFRVLREQKSWTYSAGAALRRYRALGYWAATASVRTEATDSALQEMLHQVQLIQTQLVPDSELAAAKAFLVGSFPLDIETASEVARQVTTTKLLGLDADYLRLYRERLSAVTPAEVRSAAAKLYRPEVRTIVVVGDGAKIYPKLAAIASVRIIGPDGGTMTPDQLQPPTGPAPLDLSRVAMGRDSFVANAGGNVLGWRVTSISRSTDSVMFTDSMALGQAMTRAVAAVLDVATLAPRRVDQTSTSAGQQLEVHLQYAAGRVSGSAILPGHASTSTPAIPRPVAIDTTVAPGTYDGYVLAPLICALPLAPSQSFALNVFSIQTRGIHVITVAVDSAQTLTVPAGTFKAYRVHGTGVDAGLLWYVTSDAPHRLLKSVQPGTPVVFELAK